MTARIAAHGQGRFVVILPATSIEGAEALGRRLAATCDAWLAAELPPLGLDLQPADAPGGMPDAEPGPARQPGAERRRAVTNDA